MSAANANPNVAEIRRRVKSSYEQLMVLIDTLAKEPADKLYQVPAAGEWTLMENLAHIIEVMPYWADECTKLVAQPGQNFGRTAQHAGRLAAISQHNQDSLQQAQAALPDSYEYLDLALSKLNDSDLALQGHHSKFGDQTLAWFIGEFITTHLEAHLEQMRRAMLQLET